MIEYKGFDNEKKSMANIIAFLKTNDDVDVRMAAHNAENLFNEVVAGADSLYVQLLEYEDILRR